MLFSTTYAVTKLPGKLVQATTNGGRTWTCRVQQVLHRARAQAGIVEGGGGVMGRGNNREALRAMGAVRRGTPRQCVCLLEGVCL